LILQQLSFENKLFRYSSRGTSRDKCQNAYVLNYHLYPFVIYFGNKRYRGFGQCNAFWSIATLGFERILKQILCYGNIHYVEIPTVGWSTWVHCIYQNLDNICCYIFQETHDVPFKIEKENCIFGSERNRWHKDHLTLVIVFNGILKGTGDSLLLLKW